MITRCKIIFNIILSLVMYSSGLSKDFEVVAFPSKSLVANGEKIGIFVQVTNQTLDRNLLLIGGIIDKNGTIYPKSIEYDLILYEKKNKKFMEKFAITGFLSQEFPAEKSSFASKWAKIDLESHQTACFFFEIIPFPKEREESYCLFKFRLPINNKMNEIVLNLEKSLNSSTDK